MLQQKIFYIAALVTASAINGSPAVLAHRLRRNTGETEFVRLMMAIAVYAFAYAMAGGTARPWPASCSGAGWHTWA